MQPYRAPFWLPGGHLQTLYPALWMSLPHVAYRRERWDTPDGDFIEMDWLGGAGNAATPLVVLFHGLEGGSGSHYALRLMDALQRKNWRGVVVHFRGCGGNPNRLARAYHSGDSAEIGWILRRLYILSQPSLLFVTGVSLGGNALLKWLGEEGAAAGIVAKAAAISAPFDLPASGAALGRGLNRLYAANFLKTLKPKALEKISRHGLSFDDASIGQARTLRRYDDLFTAPLHGFAGVGDYWSRAASKPYLKQIAIPTLLLNARNDPFMPATALPRPDEVPDNVTLEFSDQGGHAGFVSGKMADQSDWLPQRILTFFES
ncbi:MAG: alpha/beta fold hydrolase [Nitrosomonadales bacterium]|nr:MAG: alpha/beta fold hydrolase [Nitrosomonadales bacterium]